MRKLKSATITLMIGLALLTTSGCFQYPEGPWFTLLTRDERLQGTWAIVSVHNESGADVTSEYSDYSLTVEFKRSGERTFALFQSATLEFFGTYQFASHGNELIILYTIIDGKDGSYQVFYDVRKLTDNDLIYIDEFGNEFSWVKY